jgi:hypothetical protein
MVMGSVIQMVSVIVIRVTVVVVVQRSVQMNVRTMGNASKEPVCVSQASRESIAQSQGAAVVTVVVKMTHQHVSATQGGAELTALS